MDNAIFQEIVVEYLSHNIYPEYDQKPYFSIKYAKNGQEFVGYGTYSPAVLSEYLKEYFMPPTGEWITDDLSGLIYCSRCGNDAPMGTTGGGQYKSKFCPSCGADMRRTEDNGRNI